MSDPAGSPTFGAPEPAAHETGTAPRLLSFRIIGLLDVLRRSGTLASRREFGLTSIEWRIMTQLGGDVPLSLNDLTERLSLDAGQLSRAVKALVARGVLERRRRPGGPTIMITLTEEGRALRERMMVRAIERNDFLVGDLPSEEVALASKVFDAVIRKAEILLEQERAAASGSTLREDE